jgi:hypothetical protein|tara:strand:- start:59 stop:355 length:297 start_codon:yes stop_codon:yes gene_type:complete
VARKLLTVTHAHFFGFAVSKTTPVSPPTRAPKNGRHCERVSPVKTILRRQVSPESSIFSVSQHTEHGPESSTRKKHARLSKSRKRTAGETQRTAPVTW